VALLARGTSPWFWATWILAIILAALAWRVSPWVWLAFLPVFAVGLLMLNFFRDPERTPGPGIVAPADGVVQSIDEWEDGRIRVAIFMDPLNVHVNRAPFDGTVRSVTHVDGAFVPAFDKDSDQNERVVWIFDTAAGELEVVQIAGAVARRIVPYLEAGGRVKKGERIGMIRLGSRVDTYLPPGVQPTVALRQKSVAGVTTLAEV